MTGCLEHLVFLRRVRRVMATVPALACCMLGAFFLKDQAVLWKVLLGAPFLGVYLACMIVLSGQAEPSVPGQAHHFVAFDVVARMIWGGMVAVGAFLFMPSAPFGLPALVWLAFMTLVLLALLHFIMKRIVRLRVDQVAALMWKGVLPVTMFWLLIVAMVA